MSKLAYTAAFLAVLCIPALADTMSNARMLHQTPSDSVTVTDWYKQDVYDPNNNKIGEVMDVLVDKSGKVTSLIVGVGGSSASIRKTSPYRSMPSMSPTRTTANGAWS
jgi:hypothetical protein